MACRNGNRCCLAVGFVAINNDAAASWTRTFTTGLPAGTYCNIVHGLLNAAGSACSSETATVSAAGTFTATIGTLGGSSVPAIVIYTGQKMSP